MSTHSSYSPPASLPTQSINALSDRIAKRLPFFYGYLMLPVAMLMQLGTSPGQTFAVSAFTPALLVALDLTQSQLGLAYMLGTLVAALPLMLVGPASDRYGLKTCSAVVIIGLSVACFFASTVQGFYGLLAAFFLLRFLGQGSLTLLAGNTTAMWFRSKIGRVSAFLSVGSAFAFAWVPQMISGGIQSLGWRATYQWIGIVLLLSLLPLVLLLYRNRPEDLGQSVDGLPLRESEKRREPTAPEEVAGESGKEPEAVDAEDSDSMTLRQAARTKSYFVLGLSNVVWAMAGTGVVFYLFTLCEERSLPEGTVTGLFKVLGLAMLALQLGGGVLADFVSMNRLLGIGSTLVAAGLGWLYLDHSPSGAWMFAALFGGGQGMLIAVSGVAFLRFYGREHLGSIRGAVWCGTVAGSGLGPLIMGWTKDSLGSYDGALLVFVLLMLPLACASWFVCPPKSEIVVG